MYDPQETSKEAWAMVITDSLNTTLYESQVSSLEKK